MDGRECPVLEVLETFQELETVLILKFGSCVERTRSAKRPANELAAETRRNDRFGRVQGYVSDRALVREPRDAVNGKTADRQRRFVDVGEHAIQPLSRANVHVGRVAKEVRDPHIEHAETSADPNECGSHLRIARNEKRFLRSGVALCRYDARQQDRHDDEKTRR